MGFQYNSHLSWGYSVRKRLALPMNLGVRSPECRIGEESSPSPQPHPSPTAVELRRSRENGLLSPALSSKGGEGEATGESLGKLLNSTAVHPSPTPALCPREREKTPARWFRGASGMYRG